MPRLRYLKDRQWEPSNEDFPEVFSATDVYTVPKRSAAEQFDAPEDEVAADQQQPSGRSWLSNTAIVASIPDSKLRAALARYKSLVRLLEAEIVARSVVGKQSATGDQYSANSLDPAKHEYRHENKQFRSSSASQARLKPRQRQPKQRKQQLKLTAVQLVEALTMLSKLKAEKGK